MLFSEFSHTSIRLQIIVLAIFSNLRYLQNLWNSEHMKLGNSQTSHNLKVQVNQIKAYSKICLNGGEETFCCKICLYQRLPGGYRRDFFEFAREFAENFDDSRSLAIFQILWITLIFVWLFFSISIWQPWLVVLLWSPPPGKNFFRRPCAHVRKIPKWPKKTKLL